MSITAQKILDAIELQGELSMEGAQQLTGLRPSKILSRMAYYLGTNAVAFETRATGKYFRFTGSRPALRLKTDCQQKVTSDMPPVPEVWHAWGMGRPPERHGKPSRVHRLSWGDDATAE